MTSRYEIDQALHKAIVRGGPSRLAEAKEVSLQVISRDYDPHNTEYQSIFSRALSELKTIARVCPPWARNIVRVFDEFGAQWAGPAEREPEGYHGGLESIVTLAAKLQNPATPEVELMPLALELKRRVDVIVSGLQFEDREDSPDPLQGGRVTEFKAAAR